MIGAAFPFLCEDARGLHYYLSFILPFLRGPHPFAAWLSAGRFF